MVVEAGDPVPWTKPDDPSFNEAGPFGGPDRLNFLGLYGDIHFSLIPQKTPGTTLKALITWSGNEAVIPP